MSKPLAFIPRSLQFVLGSSSLLPFPQNHFLSACFLPNVLPLQCHVDEFCIDSPKQGDPRISEMEATGARCPLTSVQVCLSFFVFALISVPASSCLHLFSSSGLEQCLLMGLWMRFVGLHFWYREFRRPQLEGKAGVSANIDKVSKIVEIFQILDFVLIGTEVFMCYEFPFKCFSGPQTAVSLR